MGTPYNLLTQWLAGKLAEQASQPANVQPKVRGYVDNQPKLDKGFGLGAPLPPKPPIPEAITSRAAQPKPMPTESELAGEAFGSSDALGRLARVGATMGDVDNRQNLWGSGYIMSGATGQGPAQESYSPVFGVTAKVRPGAFAVGAVDPRQREWAQQEGAYQAAKRARDYQNFQDVQGPINVPDWMKRDPTFEARVRSERAAAAQRYNQLNPLPEVTAVNPELQEQAGQQAAQAAADRASAIAGVQTSPVGQAAMEAEARARALPNAAQAAMESPYAPDQARQAFLSWLFPKLQQSGATLDDVKMVATAAGVPVEEVVKLFREQNIQVQ